MQPALFPPDESERLTALRALDLLDTPATAVFDSFVRIAAGLFGVPMSAISFIDENRQWFKAALGLPTRETHRDHSFCAHAILAPGETLCVPDATKDVRFVGNPLVVGEPGIRFYAGAPITSPGGQVLGTVCVIDNKPHRPDAAALERLRDVATGVSAAIELHGAMRRLEQDARSDPLTGLGNRRDFDTRLERIGSNGAALWLLDMDRFKEINDLCSHDGGDRALQEVAARLRALTRAYGRPFRLGSDEFAVLATGPMSPEQYRLHADEIHASLADTFLIDGQPVPLRTSIGAAAMPTDAETPGELVRWADVALQKAKHAGRGTTRYAGGSPPAQAVTGLAGIGAPRLSPGPAGIGRMDLADRLRGALVPGGTPPFTLAFQPVVYVDSGETSAIEALIRWQTGPGTFVPPAEFVVLAERLGLIAHLDRWVLSTACRAATSWPEPWPVSVNISAVSFGLIDVAAMVQEALTASGLPPNRLVIEMTETALAGEAGRARHAVAGLRERGVGVALDDFGGGHASLANLRRFPFTKLKVDRSLIEGVATDEVQAQMVGLITRLGSALGIEVAIEGIETEDELRAIARLGATLVQGYLLARPVGEFDLADAVARAKRIILQNLA